METIGERLRAERERLRKTQTEMGEIGSVLKQAQIKYEGDKRTPDAAYLAAVAAAGVDVLYVLTGQRVGAAPEPAPSAFRPEHRALLDNYDACAPDDRAAIRRLAASAAQPIPRRAKQGRT